MFTTENGEPFQKVWEPAARRGGIVLLGTKCEVRLYNLTCRRAKRIAELCCQRISTERGTAFPVYKPAWSSHIVAEFKTSDSPIFVVMWAKTGKVINRFLQRGTVKASGVSRIVYKGVPYFCLQNEYHLLLKAISKNVSPNILALIG